MTDKFETHEGTLLVPMHLDALVVTKRQSGSLTIPFNRFQMQYGLLNEFMNPAGQVFENQGPSPEQGIYLHWELPDGLRHGYEIKKNDPAGLNFPYVPNRWLVARIPVKDGHTDPGNVTAWVLVGDYLNKSNGKNPFVDPFQPYEPGKVITTKLGTDKTLEEWNKIKGEEGLGPIRTFLKAIGPGNVTFAAFEPQVQDVFAFFDNAENLPKDETSITYLVLGWYSQSSIDPLTNAKWEDSENYSNLKIAEHLNWAAAPGASPPPTHTLCHGLVVDVSWKPNQDMPNPKNYPVDISNKVCVAVGNTAIDALSAFVCDKVGSETGKMAAEHLEGFQYNLLDSLDQPGGITLLDQQIRCHWFGSEPAGTLWTLVEKPIPDPAKPQEPTQLTPEQEKWLAQLNTFQRELDFNRQTLDTMQWELYALWWQSYRITKTKIRYKKNEAGFEKAKKQLPGQLDTNNPDSYINQVKKQMDIVNKLAKNVPDPTDPHSIEEFSKKIPPGPKDQPPLMLKAAKMPNFWHPTDPVLLVTGLGRSFEYGQYGILYCRLASQAFNQLKVDYQGTKILTAEQLRNCIPGVSSDYIPAASSALFIEAFFLDPNNSTIIAKNGLNSIASEAVTAVKKAIDDNKQKVPDPLNPKIPNSKKLGIIGNYGALPWIQPWVPLYLQWMVTFYSTYDKDKENFKTADWQFAENAVSSYSNYPDYQYTGTDFNPQNGTSYRGRTFLTPQSSFNFMSRLKDYLDKHPDTGLQQAQKILEQIARWDILSQTLGGLTNKLAMRDMTQNVPPPESVKHLLGSNYQGTPTEAPDTDDPPDKPYFCPVRGGFMAFDKLNVVDAFGQVLDLLKANGNPAGNHLSFKPIRALGMVPDTVDYAYPDSLAQLPPRVVQGSQLPIRPVSADDDKIEADLAHDAGANPVCGWLLPNHLDKSIAVYDAGGKLLGELIPIFDDKGNIVSVHWHPAPNHPNTAPTDFPEDPNIPNRHLENMIKTLLDHRDNGKAFSNLLQVIDETLWTVDPLGQRQDQNLSVLIGRPLAVVRANLQLQLNGNPSYNQAYWKIFEPGTGKLNKDDGGLQRLQFPVRLGSLTLRDDGLIGYFQQALGKEETDYKLFHAVHVPDKNFTPANPPYIEKIGYNNVTKTYDYIQLKFKPTPSLNIQDPTIPVNPFDPSDSVYVTMLLDPRGKVHAYSGLQPVNILTLPDRYVKKPLNNMRLTFRVGPLLLDPGTLRIPKPAEQKGTWTWIQATGTEKGNWAKDPIVQANDKARLTDTPLVIREGWLEFDPNKDTSGE